MPDSAPRVSIAVPVYNGERFLRRALDSLIGQDFRDLEIIVCDNASTDGTAAICREYERRDPRVRYSRSPINVGASGNFNRAVELARGEYFKWLAHDDECEPTFVTRCLAEHQAAPHLVLVYPRTMFIDDASQPIEPDREAIDVRGARPHQRLARLVDKLNLCNPHLGLIRTSALRQTRRIGGFIAADYVLLAELAMLGEFREIPEYLLKRRIHRGSHRQANRTRAELANWFSPGKHRLGFLSERSILFLEHLRTIQRAPYLRASDRLLCAAAFVAAWTRRRLRVRLGAVRNWLVDGCERHGHRRLARLLARRARQS
ncbi:MAG: glycosyltransferase family 2 protein [Planctomycetota bacterium]